MRRWPQPQNTSNVQIGRGRVASVMPLRSLDLSVMPGSNRLSRDGIGHRWPQKEPRSEGVEIGARQLFRDERV
jgi:hypothetical protein